MDKVIVVFGRSGYHTSLRPISLGLADGFRKLGKKVAFCDCDDFDSINACFELFAAGKVAFGIGLDGCGMTWDIEGVGEINLYEKYDVPHVSVMLDLPYNKCATGMEKPCARHIVTLLDYSALDYMKYAYPDKAADAIFLPLAGMEYSVDRSVFDAEKKPYDVVVSAGTWGMNWGEENLARQWHENGTGRYIANILDDAADYLECNADNVLPALKLALAARGMLGEDYLRKMLPYCWDLLLYIKSYRRIKAVELLVRNDLPVDVFGSGWERVAFADKLRLHGPVSYEESLHVAAQAKIIFQDQAEFNHGAHDRVFTGMLNGAVVVSEFSRYLADEFEEGRDLFLFDWQDGEKQVQVIKELLADESKRLATAVSAYGKADRRHRWQHRAERILEAVNVLYDIEV